MFATARVRPTLNGRANRRSPSGAGDRALKRPSAISPMVHLRADMEIEKALGPMDAKLPKYRGYSICDEVGKNGWKYLLGAQCKSACCQHNYRNAEKKY